ncbi:MAG: alpha-hydroxy-acid oxidizing protein [Candidatus Hodarchaeota archaeon]
MSLEEVRAEARNKLKGICGVYRICDGDPARICQGQSYGRPLGIGGIGSGASFANNVKALAKLDLKMRLVGFLDDPDTSYDFFGKSLSMPIMGASVTGVNSFGGEEVISEADFCQATVLGCKEAGTLGWRGDTYTYSEEVTPGMDAIQEAAGWGVKIFKPRAQDVLLRLLKRAEGIGMVAVGTDIDGRGSSIMRRFKQPVFAKSVDDLKELASTTSLPFIVKGVMAVEDAEAAVDAGASAIVVSNHGGRVLDHTPGTAEVLPEIARAVKGKIRVIVDGGVRTGYDVLKMLALGAEAVLVGRDIIRAAVGGGAEGVRLQMEYLREMLKKAMLMTNCSSLNEITPEILWTKA